MEKGGNDPEIIKKTQYLFGVDPQHNSVEVPYIKKRNENGGRCYFIKDDVRYLPEIISECLERDVICEKIEDDFHVNHIKKKGKDIYYFINSLPEKRTINLSCLIEGKPEIWDPFYGLANNMKHYYIKDGRTFMRLAFEPYQGLFVVFSPVVDEPQVLKTNLDAVTALKMAGETCEVEGKAATAGEKSIDIDYNGNLYHGEISVPEFLPPIPLEGKWRFSLDPYNEYSRTEVREFDFIMSDSPKDNEIPDFNNKSKRIMRYGSPTIDKWNAEWIGYRNTESTVYNYYRKSFKVSGNVQSAWISMAVYGPYDLYVNGEKVGSIDPYTADYYDRKVRNYDLKEFLQIGGNIIAVRARSTGLQSAFILEGKAILDSGDRIGLLSDRQWKVNVNEVDNWNKISLDDSRWLQPAVMGRSIAETNSGIYAFSTGGSGRWRSNFLAYPLPGKIMDIKQESILWYGFALSPAAKRIDVSSIKGRNYTVYINKKEIHCNDKWAEIPDSFESVERYCVIKIIADGSGKGNGILEPLRIECGKSEVYLGSWADNGLVHYSGGAVYEKEFELPETYLNENLALDLGKIKIAAEVWVNDQNVGIRIWKPYIFLISKFVNAGKNKVKVKVVNTLANFCAEPTIFAGGRFKNINYPEALESGLIGPVKIFVAEKTSAFTAHKLK